MSIYDVGETAVLTVSITDPSTNKTHDPTSVVCEVLPAGSSTVQTPLVSQLAPGLYQAEVPITNNPGQWTYRFVTTGPAGAQERKFTVNTTLFPGG
jgi:hypothetical protein